MNEISLWMNDIEATPFVREAADRKSRISRKTANLRSNGVCGGLQKFREETA